MVLRMSCSSSFPIKKKNKKTKKTTLFSSQISPNPVADKRKKNIYNYIKIKIKIKI